MYGYHGNKYPGTVWRETVVDTQKQMSSSDSDSDSGREAVPSEATSELLPNGSGASAASSRIGAPPPSGMFSVDSTASLASSTPSLPGSPREPPPAPAGDTSFSAALAVPDPVTPTPAKPVEVDLSQNFELSLSTNEQLFTLLKKSHMDNETLTSRVHELERENKRLVAALQQAEAGAAAGGGTGIGVGGGAPGDHGHHALETPGVGNGAGSGSYLSMTPSGRHGGGPALSTVVAERDAALSEMESLETRAREAEQNADRMVDAMRQKNDSVASKLRAAEDTSRALQEKLARIEGEREHHATQISERDEEVRRCQEAVEEMKVLVNTAEDTARNSSRRAQRLQSQTLDLKRRLNQMAQDLVASEEDIRVTAQNKTHLEQSVIGLRGEVKRVRGLLQQARTECEREGLAKADVMEKLKLERRQRRREHEANCRRVIGLEKQLGKKLLLGPGGGRSRAGSRGSHKAEEASLEVTAGVVGGRSPMEVELLRAQREESKLKDESLKELAAQVKALEGARSELSLRADTLSRQCGHLEDLNQVLLAENTVCIALLAAEKNP